MSALDDLPTPEELRAAAAVIHRAEECLNAAAKEAGLEGSVRLSTGFFFDGKYTDPEVNFRSHKKLWSIDGRRAYSMKSCIYRRDVIAKAIAEGTAPK